MKSNNDKSTILGATSVMLLVPGKYMDKKDMDGKVGEMIKSLSSLM